ncbi:MAG: hypothetical protein AB7V50_05545 [Vampirovibrionia bacterium]
MREVTITEFAHINNISVSAVYKRISRGRLKTTQGIRNNQKCTLILVDDSPIYNEPFQPVQNHRIDMENYHVHSVEESVQEAEFISESTQHNLVSMENTTFEQLIQKITELADARSEADRESLKRLEAAYLELNAEYKEIREKMENYKIESIQYQAELKISQLRITELEKENEELKNTLNTANNKKTFWNIFKNS